MYKSIFALLIVGLLLAGPVLADPPPAGWGNDPQEWDFYTGDYAEFALYEPDAPFDCLDWNVYIGEDLQAYSFIALMEIHLWVELYASMSMNVTNVQIHRLGMDGESFYIYIGGIFSSNHPQVVCLDVCDPDDNINQMNFVHDIFGNPDQAAQYQAPGIVWAGCAGQYDPQDGMPDPEMICYDAGLCLFLNYCDWWIWWRGYICIPYHLYDGYYLLSLCVCPMPGM